MGAKKLKLREDVLTTSSDRRGLGGLVETFLRRFRTLSFVLLISPLAVMCCLCLGLASAPGIFVFDSIRDATSSWPVPLHYIAVGTGAALGYLTYGVSLIFIVPLFNFLFPFKVKPFRGPWFSLPAIPWFVHNGLTYMVRFTFLEFVTPSPLNVLFYRMMGMKIGRGVVINTTYISDPCLITLEDYVTLGGSATVFGHYGQKGYLIIDPVHIGKGANIGLKASIMGGVKIGRSATVKPHSVVLPKTEVPDKGVV